MLVRTHKLGIGLSLSCLRRFTPLTFALTLLVSIRAFAVGEVPRTFTLDGRLYSNVSLSTPLLDSGASLKIDVLNPAKNCIIYTETKSVDTSTSDGYFNVSVGAPSMVLGFYNSNTIAPGTPGCAGGYSPSAGDKRFLRVTVTPTVGTPEVLTPDLAIESLPSAFVAESVQGLDRSKLLELGTNAQLTQSNIENIFSVTNYPKLTDLLSGSATEYVRTGANGSALAPGLMGNASTPAAGQFWFDTTANVLKYYDGTTVQTLSGAVASQTSGTIGGTTVVNTSGNITTSGTLSGNQVSALSVTLYDSDRTHSITLQTPATGLLTSNYSLTLPVDDGTGGQVLTTNGSGVLSWSAAASGLPSGTDGQFLRNTSGTWGGARINITDIRSSLGMNPAVFPSACTTSQTLRYDVMTDTFTCADINLAGTVTANGVLPVANGGTGSNNGSITGTTALTFTAGGTNQNIVLTPSGSGNTILGGNVGIGTSNPDQPLVVVGNIQSRTFAGNYRGIISSNGGDRGSLLLYDNSNTVKTLIESSGASYFMGGSVGINTTAPDTKLDVRGTSGTTLKIVDGNQASGRVLTSDANGVAYWAALPAAGGTGTVTSVTSANTDIGIATTTTTPVLTLNVGTGANQILKLNGTSQIPAVDGSLLTALNAANLGSGTIQAARMPALTGDVTTTVNTVATTLSAIKSVPLTITTLTTNDYLKYNGTAWVNTPLTVTGTNFGSQSQNLVFAAPTSGSGAPAFRALTAADLPGGSLNGTGTTGAVPYYSGASTLANSPISVSSGNIGIGTTTPDASVKLEVRGSIRSVSSTGSSLDNAAATVDWSKGNNQSMSVACTSTTFTNLVDGATYNLLVTDTSATTCVFSQTGLTFLSNPANGSRTLGLPTIYSFTRFGSNVVMSWASLNP